MGLCVMEIDYSEQLNYDIGTARVPGIAHSHIIPTYSDECHSAFVNSSANTRDNHGTQDRNYWASRLRWLILVYLTN